MQVEIGGDTQSTDGTEASHIHSLNPPLHNCDEGYEFWLLQVSQLEKLSSALLFVPNRSVQHTCIAHRSSTSICLQP